MRRSRMTPIPPPAAAELAAGGGGCVRAEFIPPVRAAPPARPVIRESYLLRLPVC